MTRLIVSVSNRCVMASWAVVRSLAVTQRSCEVDFENVPAVVLVASVEEIDRASFRIEQLLHDEESQSAALASSFRSDEWLKERGFNAGVNPCTVVAHAKERLGELNRDHSLFECVLSLCLPQPILGIQDEIVHDLDQFSLADVDSEGTLPCRCNGEVVRSEPGAVVLLGFVEKPVEIDEFSFFSDVS